MVGPVKLQIDLRKCARTGQCYYMHPELVRRGADDWPEAIVAPSAPERSMAEQIEAAADVVDLCPQVAIVLRENRD